ncbi:acyl-CoA dehydrogenase family protein [Gordonia sp. PDNC005]|uniref:acyl-CoA dehydrogenase family protein n=1 Tax=unclassified Gordonia (in: high G+C Gram-positive bacteria) TaxID=2657482 RepID=UPI0019633BB2|nr:acyl-CoA dehydrogenase family protein [Gordonia sp. PDNC005]QRY61234.1 acyl-CoA dehydrogenase family protein [Gordonia sp. PDNC005]
MPYPVLNDDDRIVVETARDFARKRLAPHSLEWDATKHFPVEEMAEAASLGMAAIYTREDVGGSGLRRIDGVRIFEELAKADPVTAAYLSIHNMCTWMVDTYGTDEQRKRFVPKMASMEFMASYCLTEPGAGSDAAALSTSARRDEDEWVLRGSKQFISGGGVSDVYVVMARTGDAGARGISTFVVERNAPGLSFGPAEAKMGWHNQPTAQVIFDDVRVPADAVLGGVDGEGTGFSIAMNGLNGGRLNIAACSLGGAQSAYDAALKYVADRQAFGAPLIDEPTIRATIAEMAMNLEASRLMLWRAAEAVDVDDPDKVELCAMAKRFVTEHCFTIADQALQLHGGYGYLHETGVEKIVRDLRVNRILEGTNEIMRMVIGRAEAARVTKEKTR